ncbi:MAG: chromosome segregation protein SMC [Syntrophaceae bacterium]|nr:chromosome segregation protein SMC [Syntrophaceae bacterium]
MRIKRLEIKGFKSFPDRTVLEFGPGVTCVVGPNGSGKSNILEALRWVMREQRVKVLRSRKMDDVIFNGSETLKPVGLAEVRLILVNSSRTSSSVFADYDEIMVCRRLFRDGSSHYEINNIPCRLSDITDFFLDTGVGKNSYAIIEQGRVEQIVAAKPEDRRLIIEEAAGVNKYKLRKEIALKKLETTNQNLLRLSDIIGEVRSQSISLRRQSQRALRYQKLLSKLQSMEISMFVQKVARWNQEFDSASQKIFILKIELDQTEAELIEKNAALEKQRFGKVKAEEDYRDILEKKHVLELDLRSNRERMERTRERLNDVRTLLKNIDSQAITLNENKNKASEEYTLVEETLSEAKSKLIDFSKELETAQEIHSNLADNIFQNRKLLNRLRDDLFKSLQESALAKNKKESLVRRKQELEVRLERRSAERGDILAQIESAKKNIETFLKKIANISEFLKKHFYIQEQLSQEKNSLQKVIQELVTSIREREKDYSACLSRLQTLEEIQVGYHSYRDSIKRIMNQKNQLEGGKILEPVGEIIDAPSAYYKALAAVLQNRFEMIVSSSVMDSVSLTDQLRKDNLGRVSFVPIEPRFSKIDNPSKSPENATPLIDLVTVRAGYESLAGFLLQDVYVVEGFRKAAEIWDQNGLQVNLVTKEGEYLSRFGEVSGGSEEILGEQVLKKRHEINDLKQKVANFIDDLHQAKASLGEKERKLDQLKSKLVTLSEEISRSKIEELRLQSQHENLKNILSTSVSQMQTFDMAETRFRKEIGQIYNELQQTDSLIETMTKKSESIELEKQKYQSMGNVLHQENSDHQGKIEKIKIQSAKFSERVRSLERELKSAQEKILYSDQQLKKFSEERTKGLEMEKQLLEKLDAVSSQETQLMMSHRQINTSLESFKSAVDSHQKNCSRLEHEVHDLNKTVKKSAQQLHELEVENARLEESILNAKNKIREKYNIDLNEAQAFTEEISEQEINSVREEVTLFGPVNLAAIEESKSVEERLEYLKNQQNDLKKAVATLHETIDAINQTTRERFIETFQKVDQQFQEIFPFLFGGGQARLELSDTENPLETGVSIMVRPPGKRFQNMDLLSGGEKALTAVALIFSIFLINPSPFCLLDEVDAPLDDSNLARFNKMLRKLSQKTQFLVVTHNKMSMKEADALFGVTMEEPGASKVVSVKFVD